MCMDRPNVFSKFQHVYLEGKTHGPKNKDIKALTRVYFSYEQDPFRDPSFEELGAISNNGDRRLSSFLNSIGELEHEETSWIACLHAPEGLGKSTILSFACGILRKIEKNVDYQMLNQDIMDKMTHSFSFSEIYRNCNLDIVYLIDQVNPGASFFTNSIEHNLRYSNLQLMCTLKTGEFQYISEVLQQDRLAIDLESELRLIKLENNSEKEWHTHYFNRLSEAETGSPIHSDLLLKIIQLSQRIPSFVNFILQECFKHAYFSGMEVVLGEHLEQVLEINDCQSVLTMLKEFKEDDSIKKLIIKQALRKHRSHEAGVSYKELIKLTNLKKSSLRHHLKTLSEAKILTPQRSGRNVTYHLRDVITPLLEASEK